MRPNSDVVLRLHVRNHPGVMSHVCGLFARRAFNVEGIVCVPVGDAARSAILLLVHDDERLEQVMHQLRKLEDVIDIERAHDAREVSAAVELALQAFADAAGLRLEVSPVSVSTTVPHDTKKEAAVCVPSEAILR